MSAIPAPDDNGWIQKILTDRATPAAERASRAAFEIECSVRALLGLSPDVPLLATVEQIEAHISAQAAAA